MSEAILNERFETAEQACDRLNVSAQTLYAYVSRGLLRSEQHAGDSRKRVYSSLDIDQLVRRKNRGRSRRAVAQSTINFGEPILRSRISSIADGQFYYRANNAVEVSRTASLEDIFELLCQTSVKPGLASDTEFISKHRLPFARFVDALSNQVTRDNRRGNKRYAYSLLRLMTCNAAKQSFHDADEPIHQLLARAWTSDKRAADLIRRALVLSADHELNASTYAARVTASAGASLSACLLSGISTLSGDYHGGLTNQCLAWMQERSAQTFESSMLVDYSGVKFAPGFGHRLYPSGDPRAIEMLEHLPATKRWSQLANKVIKSCGIYPTLDYGLANLEHQLKLPKGAGFSIFAVGRTVGWLAHCFEQRQNGGLISRERPYKTYANLIQAIPRAALK